MLTPALNTGEMIRLVNPKLAQIHFNTPANRTRPMMSKA